MSFCLSYWCTWVLSWQGNLIRYQSAIIILLAQRDLCIHDNDSNSDPYIYGASLFPYLCLQMFKHVAILGHEQAQYWVKVAHISYEVSLVNTFATISDAFSLRISFMRMVTLLMHIYVCRPQWVNRDLGSQQMPLFEISQEISRNPSSKGLC